MCDQLNIYYCKQIFILLQILLAKYAINEVADRCKRAENIELCCKYMNDANSKTPKQIHQKNTANK